MSATDRLALTRETLLARLYDWEHDAFLDDLDLYVALARRSEGPILEVACGSGRVLAAVAALGRKVLGIDISEAMLARARARLQEVQSPVNLRQQDMHEDLPGGPFGLAIFALSGFGFSLVPDRQIELLQLLRRHLNPDGILVLDLVTARALLAEPEGVAILQRHGVDNELGVEVTKWMVQTLHAADETVELFSSYDITWPDGQASRMTDATRFRYFSRFEIELLLAASGFLIEGIYGTYDLGPFQDESERMIVLARPRPGAHGAHLQGSANGTANGL